MTDEERAAIRARAEAATPGPWTPTTADSVAGGNIYGQGWVVASAAIYPPDGWTADGFPSAPKAFIDTDANAAFIAHARTDIPALLDENTALRTEVERLKEDIRWLFADKRGEPHLASELGETEHTWAWEGYENRYVTDYDLDEPGYLKLRRVKCATCGQTWTHP